MSTPPTATTTTILRGEEATELARLLSYVEDWLLHTDEFVTGDLARFLDSLWRGPATVDDLIAMLGEFSVLLGRRAREGQVHP